MPLFVYFRPFLNTISEIHQNPELGFRVKKQNPFGYT